MDHYDFYDRREDEALDVIFKHKTFLAALEGVECTLFIDAFTSSNHMCGGRHIGCHESIQTSQNKWCDRLAHNVNKN